MLQNLYTVDFKVNFLSFQAGLYFVVPVIQQVFRGSRKGYRPPACTGAIPHNAVRCPMTAKTHKVILVSLGTIAYHKPAIWLCGPAGHCRACFALREPLGRHAQAKGAFIL